MVRPSDHDGNRLGRPLGGAARDVIPRDNDVDVQPDHLGGKLREPFGAPAPPPPLDRHALALDVAQLPQPLSHGVPDLLILRGNPGESVSDAGNLPRRLPSRGERRGEEAPGYSPEECSPIHHSIT